MTDSVERRAKDRRIGKDRRTHEMDEFYERSVGKKIVKEHRKGEERRKIKRRTTDKLKMHLRAIRKKGEDEFLGSV